MKWKLNKVSRTEATIDISGVYVIINRKVVKASHKQYSGEYVHIRLDIMLVEGNEPLQSFEGLGNDVRKAAVNWLAMDIVKMNLDNYGRISLEHASYIGYEIARAMQDINYIQD